MKNDICPWSKLITFSGKAGRWVACGRRRDGGDLARKWVLDNLFRAVQVLCSRINLKVWQVTPKLYFLPTLILSIILMFHALFFWASLLLHYPLQQRHSCFRDSRGKLRTTWSAKNPAP